MNSPIEKKVVFILASSNFRDEEYFQTKVILQASGVSIDTAAVNDPEEMTGTQGGKAKTTIQFSEISPNIYDGLILVGGHGSKKYFHNKKVHKILNSFYHHNRAIGAIGLASGILVKTDFIKKLELTGSLKVKKYLCQAGGIWSNNDLVVDKKIITARGPVVAFKFGERFGKILIDE